ncbi:TPA: Dam family site-specific DNA-(adenine-N6)-methyltransferase [Citrobacter freundii]|nr:Dam family site-specific DNA-(adenine-N6)-methyltransferase [Citrobacter freundii]HCD1268056.1 Dam family site-specific DNA-(adenine-N6)-methyltransferase [Citrobacter freundii]
MILTYGSVCSGIEAASCAWEPLGHIPLWFSEIEDFPCRVLAHHWPHVSNLGDMTALTRRITHREVQAPMVLVGGTPCQGFSLAGLRQSLDDERSVLALEYIRIANAIDYVHEDDKRPPCIAIWENVPGVLNTDDNAFGNFLAGLAGDDSPYEPSGNKWADAGVIYGPQRVVAWRVLDGQFFGVAQRRKRVFVIASARNDFDPAAVLFECESLHRNTEPSREKEKELAAAIRASLAQRGEPVTPSGFRMEAFGQYADDETASTMKARDYKDATDLIVETDVLTFPAQISGTQFASAGGDVSQTIQAKNPVAVAYSVALRGRDGGTVAELGDDVSPALRSAEGGGCKSYVLAFAENDRAEVRYVGGDGQVVGALATRGGKPGQGFPAVLGMPEMVVRRLLPSECEILQGFPRLHTFIPVGKYKRMTPDELAYARAQRPDLTDYELERMAKDGPRYKALGNSMAVPVMRWLMEQITTALDATCKPSLQVQPSPLPEKKMTKSKKALAAPKAPAYQRAFLKWAGGKYDQLDVVLPLVGTGNRLIEPFVGAGSVFLNAPGFNSYLLGDNSPDLMLLWDALQLAPDLLISHSRRMFEEKNDPGGFEFIRKSFNENGYIKIQRAAAFLYLNRHSFNGLMRYNLKGEFNTSYGHYKKPYFPEAEMYAFLELNAARNIKLACQSFVDTCREAGEGDVLFCDPPYMPMPDTDGFTSYSKEPFKEEHQWQLLNEMVQAHQRGARVVVTNSSAPELVENYKKAGFVLKEMFARRSMSCKGASRKVAIDIIGVLE